jgi:hypothetical protein
VERGAALLDEDPNGGTGIATVAARMRAAVVATLLWLSVSVPAASDWRVATATDPASGSSSSRAVTENADGFRFEIDGGAVERAARCVLTLPAGKAVDLDADRPLELRVDDFEAQAVLRWAAVEGDPHGDGGDFLEVARRAGHVAPLLAASSGTVAFRCWIGLPRQSTPTRGPLRQVLEGQRLVVRYFPAAGGSEETAFDLAGAAAAIGEALALPLEPTAEDHLQDTLLGFRVQYRGSTCYLLAGKKSRERCLAAVNRCAALPQESVVAMTGCVEVE